MADLAFKGVEKGSPRPAARPRIWHSMIPPTESRSPLASKMAFLAASPFADLKRKCLLAESLKGFRIFSQRLERPVLNGGNLLYMSTDGNATACDDWLATAPAKTRGAVMRPENGRRRDSR